MAYDVIIIGSGPAGVSAALYLKRFNHNVLVISNGDSALHKAHKIDNYYGFSGGSGKELYEMGIKQLHDLEIDYIEGDVVGIDYYGDFVVKFNEKSYTSKYLIIATGKARNKLKIKNAERFEMKGISYCAVCDGFFYRNKKIGIIGDGEYMQHELAFLSQFTKEIIIFTDGKELESEYQVVSDKFVSFIGDEYLTGVETTANTYQLDGVFVAIGSMGTFDLVKHLGIEVDDKNNLIVGDKYQTNIPNLYAIGDAVGGVLQISKAVYDGMAAAYGINESMRHSK